MRALLFLKAWSLYNAGETAGFESETAETLIAAGVAVDAEEAVPTKAAPKKAAPKKAATKRAAKPATAAAEPVAGSAPPPTEGPTDAA